MRVAVVLEKDLFSVEKQLLLENPNADAYELRLDGIKGAIDLNRLRTLLAKVEKPIIITLRRKDQGGSFEGTEEERLSMIEKLLFLQPDYIDLEYNIKSNGYHRLYQQALSNEVKVILSYHHLNSTPLDLLPVYQELHKLPFHALKIVTRANSSIDVLRIMLFMKETNHPNLSCMCLGADGYLSRVLAKACGSKMVYGYLGRGKIEGQVSLDELATIYNISSGKDKRNVYALIGDPVDQSIGHVFHNNSFQKRALYVKIPLPRVFLKEFFAVMKRMELFEGLSVTTPLKEEVISFLDEVSTSGLKINGVNTLTHQDGKLFGENTDGKGALDAIEKKTRVSGKKIAIIGTGPTARAIAYEGLQRKARVTLFSRSPEVTREKIGFSRAEVLDLKILSRKDRYDCFIDATGRGVGSIPSCYEEKDIPTCELYMHLSKPSEDTELLVYARNLGATCVYAEDFFVQQAERQQEIWSSQKVERIDE